MENKTVQETYEIYLEKFNKRAKRYVPIYKVKKNKHVLDIQKLIRLRI